MKDRYTVTLFDPAMKTYDFTYIAKDVTEAVTKAMDAAFKEMPDNSFMIAGITGDEKKIEAYFNED